MKIGVTGATGQLGSLVVELLRGKVGAENIVALARTPEKARKFGVEVRAFNYDKSDKMVEALGGIDRLLLISASDIGQRARQHSNVIEAAKEAGVKWIVYTSLLHANSSTLNLAGEHLATEKLL
ncbi:MAG: NAD(P)H-binding protein [Bacteroidales bacterium]